eukprot:621421-Alexandrium_andersonii.AAC.1
MSSTPPARSALAPAAARAWRVRRELGRARGPRRGRLEPAAQAQPTRPSSSAYEGYIFPVPGTR